MLLLTLDSSRFVSSKTTEMKSAVPSWADIDIDTLLKIFKLLNMIELASVSQVCRSWHAACSNPWLWNTLDLELLKSNFIQTTARPYIWVNIRSDRNLMTLLQLAMALSRGNITILIFHFNLYMNDEHLTYISERCPHLKQLVLPAWNRITKWAICDAFHRWQELESLTMPTVAHPPYIMEAIGRSCKNLSSLKVMGTFDIQFASSIICHLPNLKVLSLRCSILTKDALMFILHCMDHLEVLNISHCMLLENLTPSGRTNIIRELDQSILGKTSRLREFYYCMSQSCTTCQRMTADEGLMRWYRYEEWFWREDEVSSLSLGRDYGKLFDEGCLDLGFRN
ncbi:F-box/LRR-repeat protein-like [Iris pallida]|uniref:F-box/LRR-repeat protein-like n=1 Tax=Iris pallida TaxID=29817 RepID=A0AAX6H3M8_IRIPA|nr:F-box/LRR-repeat protein-like [Iris pallida]